MKFEISLKMEISQKPLPIDNFPRSHGNGMIDSGYEICFDKSPTLGVSTFLGVSTLRCPLSG